MMHIAICDDEQKELDNIPGTVGARAANVDSGIQLYYNQSRFGE